MPHRLSRMAESLRARQLAKPARNSVNDNLASEACLMVAAPEPVWQGPGIVVSLGVQDGRHRMGAVRVMAPDATDDPVAGTAVLLRLLEHYGAWMGFEGEAEPVHPGEVRPVPTVLGAIPGEQASVEYRLDLRNIGRDSQQLTADGTILLDGRPVFLLDGVSIVFRRTGPTPRRRQERRTRRDA
ncbi:hotdog family protein [Roseomonas populi]|uniref:Uncharacterized protein n=1 Tax=Roseomonas populi TaxID=3121582 RepID=A0ABT1X8A7_9PROT|nr:hypothetical protein [Roseomonas pecuniae]MCR0984336.1 hypothetical protein [Roseomonas pecuniae]